MQTTSSGSSLEISLKQDLPSRWSLQAHGLGGGVGGDRRLSLADHRVIVVIKTMTPPIPKPRPKPSFAEELSAAGCAPEDPNASGPEEGRATPALALVAVAHDDELVSVDELSAGTLVGVIGPKSDDARDETEASATACTALQYAEKDDFGASVSQRIANRTLTLICWAAILIYCPRVIIEDASILHWIPRYSETSYSIFTQFTQTSYRFSCMECYMNTSARRMRSQSLEVSNIRGGLLLHHF